VIPDGLTRAIVCCLAPEDGQGFWSVRQSENGRPLHGIRPNVNKGLTRRRRVLQNPHSRVRIPSSPPGQGSDKKPIKGLGSPGFAWPALFCRCKTCGANGLPASRATPVFYRGHSAGKRRSRARLPKERLPVLACSYPDRTSSILIGKRRIRFPAAAKIALATAGAITGLAISPMPLGGSCDGRTTTSISGVSWRRSNG
jgi:hypothetical protein